MFGSSKYDDYLEVIKDSETKVLARINQMEARVETVEKKLELLSDIKRDIEKLLRSHQEVKSVLDELKLKKSKNLTKKNKRGQERDEKLLSFLSVPRTTLDVVEKFNYSRTYISTLLNKYKKKGIVKIVKRIGNIPYFEVKNG